MDFKEQMLDLITKHAANYNICGVVSTEGNVYPLGSDTKVLSTIFELFSRPIIQQFADENGYEVVEPTKQNHYPDFTIFKKDNPSKKIAIDVKTTYVDKHGEKFSYTLGGYTSFIRNNTKNIVFPFNEYAEHWVMGYVYTRVAQKKAAEHRIYSTNQISAMSLPYENVETFFQEKWKISGDKAGSGNTTNIGSISGTIEDFRKGNGCFKSEVEFLDYWKNYERTAAERIETYSDIDGYREWLTKKSR